MHYRAIRRFSCGPGALNVGDMTTLPSGFAAPVISRAELTDLSEDVSLHGIAAVDDALPRLVGAARAVGVPEVLPAVLCSADEPEVARIRAFVKITYRLTSAAA